MQFSLVQMLSGAGAPPAVLKAAEGDAADISGGKANFAAMLGDANAQQQSGQGRAVPLPVAGVTAKLLAQEIDAAALVDAAPLSDASLQAVLAQPITPAKAKELLTQVEALQASVAEAIAQEQAGFEQSGTPQEQWQQGLGELAEALQEIANGEQTVTVGEVVEGLPIATAEPTTEGVPTLQRMLRWMHQRRRRRRLRLPHPLRMRQCKACRRVCFPPVMMRLRPRPRRVKPKTVRTKQSTTAKSRK